MSPPPWPIPPEATISARSRTLRRIEELCQAPVVAYALGGGHQAGSSMSQADVAPFYRVLKETRDKTGSDKLVLLVHARGGDAYVPKQLIRLVRSFFNEYVALVPHRAHSAATHLVLGADRLLLTRLSELTPAGGSTPQVERSDLLALEAYEAARRSADQGAPELVLRLVEKIGADRFAALLGLNNEMRHLTREILAPRFDDPEKLERAVSAFVDRSHLWRLGVDDLRAAGITFAETCSPEMEVAALSLVRAYSMAFGPLDAVDGLEALNFTGEKGGPARKDPTAEQPHPVVIRGATAPPPTHHVEKHEKKEAPEGSDPEPPEERPSPRPLQARVLRGGYIESRVLGYVHVRAAETQLPWAWIDRLDFDPPG